MDCGFQDPAYFARVFKKTYNESSRNYRQRAKSS
ncbi:MAG: AraC family transcriptional regulator [Candidatus Latescibacteria bacterium]|nr:AraC family transcriptional regulator [Candidatus Latescibacterota bacterium]MBT5830256.1 AraC family transcriptional regulator [Candidatus Latescibacterota bacterium]